MEFNFADLFADRKRERFAMHSRHLTLPKRMPPIVPAGALFRKGDIWNVFAVVNGRAEARAVTLLPRSGRLAAVSDRVIVSG